MPCISGGFFSTEPPGKPLCVSRHIKKSEKINGSIHHRDDPDKWSKEKKCMQQSNTQRFHFSEKQSNNKEVKVKSLSRVRLLATLWTVAYQAPQPMGFSRQEYWSGLPFPSPGDLPNPGIKPGSPALQADSLLSELPGKPHPSCYVTVYL